MTAASLISLVWSFFKLPLLRPNKPCYEQAHTESSDGYDLHVIEFDDQGMGFHREEALNGLMDSLAESQAKKETPIIVVFVHGWKHNALDDDGNLVSFQELLAHTAAAGTPNRPVVGVYLSWRGLSRYGNFFWLQSSFWSRQKAAERIAQGSPREVLGRLKAFRNGEPGGPPQATLVIVGHSFGGLIVYTAIAQSLIESAASPEQKTPSFGDLVILVNPAFSAISYLPIWTIVQSKKFDGNQLPVCVSVTATNDWATGIAYPIGSFLRLINERFRGCKEGTALTHTMGHLAWMRTHTLELASPSDSNDAATANSPGEIVTRRALAHAALLAISNGETQTFGGVRVVPAENVSPSPFWVASAPPTIIDGHNGIFKPSFIAFARGLIGAHISK